MKNLKSLIIILVVLPLTFILLPKSCSSDEISPAELKRIEKETAEQQELYLEQVAEDDRIKKERDSLINLAVQKSRESLKDSIQIIKSYTSTPNSAGGVDLHIVWKNKTKRIVKYARFEVSAINAVNDEVYSEVGVYSTSEFVTVTGPVKPNKIEGYGSYWPCVWYNSTIKKCTLISVELEFMDGTKLEITL